MNAEQAKAAKKIRLNGYLYACKCGALATWEKKVQKEDCISADYWCNECKADKAIELSLLNRDWDGTFTPMDQRRAAFWVKVGEWTIDRYPVRCWHIWLYVNDRLREISEGQPRRTTVKWRKSE